MEQLKDLMTELQIKSGYGCKPLTEEEYERKKAEHYNESMGHLNEVDGYNCDICKNKGYIAKAVKNEQFGYWSEMLEPCKCDRIRTAIRRLNSSGLKNVVKEYTFDKYECPEEWQQLIKRNALRFCNDDTNHWFFIGGQSGAGKTHICTAIAVHYIRQGKECKYMLWRDEITKLKGYLGSDHGLYDITIQELKEIPVLYIDDMFKSGKGDDGKYKPPTAADVNAAFEIINYRYNNPGLITIISSERTLTEIFDIDEAIAGRITERTKGSGYCFNLRKDRSRNWRLKGLDEI